MANKQQPGSQFPSYVPQWAQPLLLQAQQKYGIPASLLAAQINHESGFNPTVLSNPNKDPYQSVDRGIAQINNHWHPEVSDHQAMNPAWAIDWMAQNMTQKFHQYGDWAKALSAYNTGNPTQGVASYAARILKDVPGMENVIPQQNTQQPSFSQDQTGGQDYTTQQQPQGQQQGQGMDIMSLLQHYLQGQQQQAQPQQQSVQLPQAPAVSANTGQTQGSPISLNQQAPTGQQQSQPQGQQANPQKSNIMPFLMRGRQNA